MTSPRWLLLAGLLHPLLVASNCHAISMTVLHNELLLHQGNQRSWTAQSFSTSGFGAIDIRLDYESPQSPRACVVAESLDDNTDAITVWVDGAMACTMPSEGGSCCPVAFEPGWHAIYAEIAGKLVYENDQFLDWFDCKKPGTGQYDCCGWNPGEPPPDCQGDALNQYSWNTKVHDCVLRDFNLVGPTVNAILYDPPNFQWTSADDSCRPSNCQKSSPCGIAPLGYQIAYRVSFDYDFGGAEHLTPPACPPSGLISYPMPQDKWDALNYGFHTLILEAYVKDAGGAIRSVRSNRYGFYKAVPPSDLSLPSYWGFGLGDLPYKLSGTADTTCACPRSGSPTGCPPYLDPCPDPVPDPCPNEPFPEPPLLLLYPDDPGPGGTNALISTLAQLTGNFALYNLAEEEWQSELSRFAFLDPSTGTVVHPGRYAPDPIEDGWVSLVTAASASLPVTLDASGVSSLNLDAKDLPYSTESELYIAEVKMQNMESQAARITVGWGTKAPAIQWTNLPNHRGDALRLPPCATPGSSGCPEVTKIFRFRAAPPPNRPGTSVNALATATKQITLGIGVLYGKVHVNTAGIYRAREAFALRASDPGAVDLSLYFDDFDQLPGDTVTETPLLSANELCEIRKRGTLAELTPGGIQRLADTPLPLCDEPILFRKALHSAGPFSGGPETVKGSPFAQVGPHAAPEPMEILMQPSLGIGQYEDVFIAENQRIPVTVSASILERCTSDPAPPGWDFPGKGTAPVFGATISGPPYPGGIGSLDYEVWTSLSTVIQGDQWGWRMTNITPVVANHYLTKGFSPETGPHFDAFESEFRADERMNVKMELRPRSSQKLLVNLRINDQTPLSAQDCPFDPTDLTAGCYALIPLDHGLSIPLRLHIVDPPLPPERNNWVQTQLTFVLPEISELGATPQWDVCDFDPEFDPLHASPSGQTCRDDLSLQGLHGTWCDTDLDYLFRRIREHSHMGFNQGLACSVTESCPEGSPSICMQPDFDCCFDTNVGQEVAPCRSDQPFLRLPPRVANAWNTVDPLPLPSYTHAGLRIGTGFRPWVGITSFGRSAWPLCVNCEDGVTRRNPGYASEIGPRLFAQFRAIQSTGLGAMAWIDFMDNIAGGGWGRVGLAVNLSSFHDYGAGGMATMFPPGPDQDFASLLERAALDTSKPSQGSGHGKCEVNNGFPSIYDYDDLVQQLRWTSFTGTPAQYAEDISGPPLIGDMAYQEQYGDGKHNLASELFRQQSQYEHEYAPPPPYPHDPYCYSWLHDSPEAASCSWPTLSELPKDECDPACGSGCSYSLPYGECRYWSPGCVKGSGAWSCQVASTESRRWCPRFTDPQPGTPSLYPDLISYAIGKGGNGDWFMKLQEECESRTDCVYNKPYRDEQGMFEELPWKLPVLSRFSGGFWAGASNLDGFHPFHLYWGKDYAFDQHDLFSNFDAWGANPAPFLYMVEPYESPECCGSPCTGIVMTENWEALKAGYTDIRWWDALQAAYPNVDCSLFLPVDCKQSVAGCEAEKCAIRSCIRQTVFPWAVGEAPGFVPGAVDDSVLDQLRLRIITFLEQCG